MPAKKSPGPSVKDPELYEKLRREGNSKEKSARIANAAADEGRSKVGKRGGEAGDYEDRTVKELRARGFVEPEAMLELRALLRRRFAAREVIDRIARHEVQEREHQHRDPEDRERARAEPAQEKRAEAQGGAEAQNAGAELASRASPGASTGSPPWVIISAKLRHS